MESCAAQDEICSRVGISFQAEEELSDGEYDEMKEDTLDQMREFQETLQKMVGGDMTLVDEFGAMQLVCLVSMKSICLNVLFKGNSSGRFTSLPNSRGY